MLHFFFSYLIIFLYFKNISFLDAPFNHQTSFQDPASPVMEGILYLHDYIWIFLIFILIFVSWMLFRTLVLFAENDNHQINPVTQNVPLEIIWTLTPAIILSFIGGNSISHLYSAEEILSPQLDIVVTGNQWFWTYEFMVFSKKVTLESHMIDNDSLILGECRNLEVDNSLILPINTNIRLIVTSTDVIHSWAIPSLGVKIDAVPGRTNTGTVYIKREGRFFGQCSEICGKGHAVMPIVVNAVTPEKYNLYLHSINIKNYDLIKNYITEDINYKNLNNLLF
jgi:cytochrome c oxidase subunit 2